jgi:surface carbohydrate biosynthesis protein
MESKSTMTTTQKKLKWLILPIETKVRELDGKLLLAAIAAERGWGVIIGYKNTIVEDTENIIGIVLEKDGYTLNKRIHRFLDSGKLVCALDEEGLVYLNSHDYYRRRLNEENLNNISAYLLWGNVQKRDVLEYVPSIEEKLILTGNPRFDLLRPELRNYYKSESVKLIEKFGDFILVNTNFADSNHYLGTDWVIESHRKSDFITTDQEEDQELAFIQYQEKILNAFKSMVIEVSTRYPNHNIILRPHPSENHDYWNSVAEDHSNLHIIHEGDVNAWILAARMVLHNSCMTGIQAFLLDKPVVSYMPVQSDHFDYYLPNALSLKKTSLGELLFTIDEYLNQSNHIEQTERIKKFQIAENFITGMTGSFSSDRIMDILGSFVFDYNTYKEPADEKQRETRRPQETKLNLKFIAKKIVKFIYKVFQSPKSVEALKRKNAYGSQKYPGITLVEMQNRLSRLRSITGRFSSLQVKQHGDETFVIFPE